MEAARVVLGHHVEQERVCVVVERLVVQKQFRQETQVLGVALVFAAINLEKRDGRLAVDLVARRMPQIAFGQMAFQALSAFAIL